MTALLYWYDRADALGLLLLWQNWGPTPSKCWRLGVGEEPRGWSLSRIRARSAIWRCWQVDICAICGTGGLGGYQLQGGFFPSITWGRNSLFRNRTQSYLPLSLPHTPSGHPGHKKGLGTFGNRSGK